MRLISQAQLFTHKCKFFFFDLFQEEKINPTVKKCLRMHDRYAKKTKSNNCIGWRAQSISAKKNRI